jgi:hypothetical protein
MPRSRLARLACPPLLVLAGCPNTDPGADDMPVASGFAEESGPPVTTTESPSDTTATSTTAPPDLGEPWGGTAYAGDIHAVLTVTLTPAHALVDHDVVGMAGGYRSAEVGWGDAADLYSPIAYQLAFPPPPAEPDTLVPAAPVPVFDWGDDEDWLVAGNGMKLRHSTEGSELLACLIAAGNLGQYPVYRTSAAMGVAADCNPPASAWIGASVYDVVLYGGELFTDDVVAAVVTTPAELVITAPDLSMFDAPLAADQDLAIAWEAGDDPDARIIIRVVDADTNAITVHAADDGAYTIPAAELGALTPGPLDLLVARERTDRVQWSDGGLTVLGRFERWGFFDLF